MKYLVSALIALSTVFTVVHSWAAPTTTNLLPGKVYVPLGFDSNDSAEIVIEGAYSNTCYRSGMATFNVDEERKKITIYNKTYFHSNSMCLMVIVPYSKVINFGVLKEGNYSLNFVGDGENISMGKLPVAKSSSTVQDDHLYAPIERTTFIEAKNGKPAELILHGVFANSCMSLKEVELRRAPGSDTIAVLPKSEMSGSSCENTSVKFDERVSLEGYGSGRVLLHVRSLNGQSLNTIVNL